jgi:hypothetical protein
MALQILTDMVSAGLEQRAIPGAPFFAATEFAPPPEPSAERWIGVWRREATGRLAVQNNKRVAG